MAYLNDYMKLQGMTRRALSEKSGVSLPRIGAYVNEPELLINAGWETKKAIADALGITVKELLHGKDFKTILVKTEIRKAAEHLARELRKYSAEPMYLDLCIFTRDAEAKTEEDNCEGLPDFYSIRCHEASDVEGIVPTMSESARMYYKDDEGEEKNARVFKYHSEV